MKRAERQALRLELEELKIQLIDQGCQKLRDAAKRDYETFVQLIVVATRLGMTFSGEVLEIAGLKKEMVSDEDGISSKPEATTRDDAI